MAASLGTAGFGLGAAACWGVGDFTGGMGAKRANPFLIVAVAHGADFLLLLPIAFLMHDHFPSLTEAAWALSSGILNAFALVALYWVLSSGVMSIGAPISAVLAAALPVAYGAYSQGLPHPIQLAGIAVAVVSIVLLSFPSGGTGPSKGVYTAILAGVGFGFFFIALPKASVHSYLWPMAISRFGSTFVTLGMLLFSKTKGGVRLSAAAFWLALGAGLFDLAGNLFYVVAANTGRLDIAAIVASLYPGGTVILARLILKERVSRVQEIGILAALAAVAMIAKN